MPARFYNPAQADTGGPMDPATLETITVTAAAFFIPIVLSALCLFFDKR